MTVETWFSYGFQLAGSLSTFFFYLKNVFSKIKIKKNELLLVTLPLFISLALVDGKTYDLVFSLCVLNSFLLVFLMKAAQKTEKSSLEKTARVGEGRGSSLEVTPSCSKDEPVVSSAPVCSNHVPQEACRGLSPQPKVSTIQIYDPQPQEKSVWGSTYPTTDASKTCQNPMVSLSSEAPPIRKRAAETPPETLLQSVTSSPLDHPLSVKRTPSPVNVPSASESTSVIATDTPTSQTLQDEDSDPNSTKPTVNWEVFAGLLSILKENNFKINPTHHMAACDNAESSTSSENVENKSLKPHNLDSDKRETKVPQAPQSSSALEVFRSVRSSSAATSNRTPRSDPEPSRPRQQTIGTIITTRTNLVKNAFQGGKSKQTHTDVSRELQVSFHTGSTASLPDSVAPPAGFYPPHSQVAYASQENPMSLFAQPDTGCTTQNDPRVIATSSCQAYVYPNQTYPDQTRNPFSLQMVRQSSEAQMLSGWESVGVQQLQYYRFWANWSGKNSLFFVVCFCHIILLYYKYWPNVLTCVFMPRRAV